MDRAGGPGRPSDDQAFDDDEWELYHLDVDPTELHDLASEHPEKLRELAAAWEAAARFNDVYPLDEGSSIKYLIRPSWHEQLQRPITIPRGTPTLADAVRLGRAQSGQSWVQLGGLWAIRDGRAVLLRPAARGTSLALLRTGAPGGTVTLDAANPVSGAGLAFRCRNLRNCWFLEAVLWIGRTGSPWRDLLVEFGRWHTVYIRFSRWRRKGAGKKWPASAWTFQRWVEF